MDKKIQSEWDRDEQITQLKTELECANLAIKQLRQEITQLQNQITYFQNDDKHPANFFKSEASHSHRINLNHKLRQRISKSYFKNRLNLQFVAIVTAVATTLTIMGVGITMIVSKRLGERSVKPSTSRPFNSPSTPTLRPSWAIANALPIPSRQPGRENSEIVYNLKTPPEFRQNQNLQVIVNDVVNLAAAKGLPIKPLSITLIDVKTGEAAGYQQDTFRYPASVVKMFWMVILYAQIETGIWMNEADLNPYIAKMIKESDNEAASFIVDQITNTQFIAALKGEDLQTWINKRQELNHFFQKSGYKDINISQKTFPIPYLKLSEPKGNDLQLRLNSNQLTKPIRNKITTEQVARLLYEICYLRQAVSPVASKKMCGWLNRNLSPQAWKKEPPDLNEFNPIRAFFGESLSDTNVQFYSKAGWTSGSRQEVALVAAPDGRIAYILAIFADDAAYANDEKIFPRMSRLIYNRITVSNSNR